MTPPPPNSLVGNFCSQRPNYVVFMSPWQRPQTNQCMHHRMQTGKRIRGQWRSVVAPSYLTQNGFAFTYVQDQLLMWSELLIPGLTGCPHRQAPAKPGFKPGTFLWEATVQTRVATPWIKNNVEEAYLNILRYHFTVWHLICFIGCVCVWVRSKIQKITNFNVFM